MKIGETTTLGISRELNKTQSLIARSLERLSTGKRINSARDDVAGFAQVQGLDSQIRGLSQVSLGLNQSLGYLQTASSAIQTQTEIIQQMRELSVQASNGLLSDSDRANLNTELLALRDEFSRITANTNFAGTNLLDGSFEDITLLTSDKAQSTLDLNISDLGASEVFKKTAGTGYFEVGESFTLVDSNYIERADIDGDGDIDVIGVDETTDNINVYLNDGAGNFDTVITTAATSDFDDEFELADVNDDGKLDLVAYGDTNNGVSIFLGDGDGTFQEQATIAGVSSPAGLALGDFDGDGNIDLVVTDNVAESANTYFGNGDGSFDAAIVEGTFGAIPTQIQAADFDGDGIDDLVAYATDDDEYKVFTSDGDGTYTETDQITAVSGGLGQRIAIGDLDNDGDLDFISGNGSATVSLNDGSANFTDTSYATTGISGDFELADINKDGFLDIIVDSATSSTLSVLLNEGDGTYGTAIDFTDGLNIRELVADDFDNDGLVEILIAGDDGEFQILESLTTLTSAVADLNLLSSEEAEESTRILDNALDKLIEEQSSIATLQTRVESAANSNLLLVESLSEAKIGIESADFAIETANLVSAQIQQQAQIAALSQSNSQLQVVLGLLSGL